MQKRYDELLAKGQLKADAAQQNAVCHFNDLEEKLASWKLGEIAPQGIYLYGPVGRGKSMVMNLFFEQMEGISKRRVHFHAFMEELHHRMHTLKVEKGQDPMTVIAQNLAEEARLLCFDEFYITNIADAMMLGRLFQKLFEQGVTVCATSNWPPEELFQGGINRHQFLPFIRIIMKFMKPLEVAGEEDYRLQGGGNLPLFYLQIGQAGDAWLEGKIEQKKSKKSAKKGEVEVKSTWPKVKFAQNSTLWFKFDDICGAAYGRDQYLEIMPAAQTLCVSDIPIFKESEADAALRLVTLVDIAYEAKQCLICTAEAEPEALCTSGDAAQAFVRTASRLREMQGW